MKKLLFVLAIGAFAACSSGENKDAAKDSTTVAPAADSAAKAAADTTKKADTTVKAGADTTKH